MRARALSAGFIVSIAVGVAACGGGGGGGGGRSSTSGAGVTPAGTPAYVAINSDLGSDQWKKLKSLVNKFPDHAQAIGLLEASLSNQGIDYDKDVKPALGKEVDVAWIDLQNNGGDVVLLTKPKNEGKFKQLLKKSNRSGSRTYSAKLSNGWYVVGNSQSSVNSFKSKSGGKKLGADKSFKDAMSHLSGASLATAYVNGQAIASALNTANAAPGGSQPAPFNLDKLQYIAVRAKSQGDGLRLEGVVKGAGAPGSGSPTFKSKLIDGVPAGAIAFATFHGGSALNKQIQSLQNSPQFQSQLQQFERAFGVRLQDVLALVQNEVALYVRQGSPLPEFTLVLEEPNLQSSLATLDRLAAGVARRTHAQVTSGNQGGVSTKTITFPKFAVTYGGFDDRIVITSSASGIRDYKSGGSKLSGDSVYKSATSSGGVPHKTSGMLYVNLKDGVPLVENYATTAGTTVPPVVQRNLAPLRAFVAYGTGESKLAKFTAFLQIK
jgi:hypothetical protein